MQSRQGNEESKTSVKNLDLNLCFFNKNRYLTMVIGDFSFQSHNWHKGDKTRGSGFKFEIMTSY